MSPAWKTIASAILFAAMTSGVAAPALAFEQAPPASAASIADKLFAEAGARAAALAAAPYKAPANDLPKAFEGLDYDGFRKLRPRPETMVWGKTGNPFAVLPLPRARRRGSWSAQAW